jgi:GABA(A) receptor-associated protein
MKNYLENYITQNLNIKLPKKTFKEKYSFNERYNEAKNIMIKYPDRFPIICEKWGNDPDMPEIDRKKYLVPNDLGVNQFIYIIRSRMKLSPQKSLYIFINGSIMPHTGGSITEYYHKYKDDDGFLYISYSGENTFG